VIRPLALLAAAAQTPGSPTAVFVGTRGGDTISLERYSRTGNTITGTWWAIHPNGVFVHEYTIVLSADGLPVRYNMEYSTPGVPIPPGSFTGVTIRYGPDTATYVMRQDRPDTTRLAMRGAFPLLGQSVVGLELALERMRAARTDSGIIQLNPPTSPSTPPTTLPIRFTGADSARLGTAFLVRVGPDGRILGLRSGPLETVRVSPFDLAPVVARFVAATAARAAADAAAIAAHVAIALPAEALERLVGRYALDTTAVFSVTRSGDSLFVSAGGQSRLALFAESPAKFFMKAVNAEVEFDLDGSGNATALTLIQNGRRRRMLKAP
jgi:hypothetical protein